MKTIFATLALAVLCTAGSAAPPMTKTDARSLPPDVVIKRVLDQFGDILIPPQPWPKGHKPTRPLDDMVYDTKPRGTAIPGLCESEQVIFRFHPVGVHNGPQTPAIVSGIEVDRRFRFLTAPSQEIDSAAMSPVDLQALDRRCAGLDPDQGFFWADDPGLARDAVLLLRLVQSNADTIDCTDTDKSACRRAILAVDAAKLRRVDDCGDDPGTACTSIWGDTVSVTIYSESRGPRAKILRVRSGEIVTLSHEHAD